MKAIISFCILSLLFLGGCKKENPATNDLSKKDLLTNKSWKFQQIVFVQNNTLYNYSLGGSNNSYNFSKDVINFKSDGTGTYTNSVGETFNIAWQFADAEQTKINYTIYNYDKGVAKQGVNLKVLWENLQITSTYLKYAEIYTNSDGTSIISSATRIPL